MKRKVVQIFVVLALLVGYIIYQNSVIEVENISLKLSKLENAEGKVKIVHISDMHLKHGNWNFERFVKKIKEMKPDLIFITGDMIDVKSNINECNLDEVTEKIASVAPTYGVIGNHEIWNGDLEEFERIMEDGGVTLLRNDNVVVKINNIEFNIYGVDYGYKFGNIDFENKSNVDSVNILLNHTPDIFEDKKELEKVGIDLIFSGHAHGGQFRVPFIDKGIVAPDQGFFPKYTSGVYKEENYKMILSRGIGNSIIPVRINNRPHIPLVELEIFKSKE